MQWKIERTSIISLLSSRPPPETSLYWRKGSATLTLNSGYLLLTDFDTYTARREPLKPWNTKGGSKGGI